MHIALEVNGEIYIGELIKQKEKEKIPTNNIGRVSRYLSKWKEKKNTLIYCLLIHTVFNKDDIAKYMGCDTSISSEVISVLAQNEYLLKRGKGYMLSILGKKILTKQYTIREEK